MRPLWTGAFATGAFDEWSSWRRNDGGTFYVAQPSAESVPAPPTGDRYVGRFELTRAQIDAGRVHSKLYKGWDVNNARRTDDAGRPFSRMTPGQEAGTYTAWFYLPSDYSMKDNGPLDIFQFKEDYSADSGATFNGFGSDVQTDMSIWNAQTLKGWSDVFDPSRYNTGLRADHPLLAVALYHNPKVRPRPGHQRVAMPAPLGRWFNITAKLYPRDRVEYWVDGRLLDTWYHDEYPVGIRLPNAMGWTFGVGHYGSNVGKLWTAGASFTPFG